MKKSRFLEKPGEIFGIPEEFLEEFLEEFRRHYWKNPGRILEKIQEDSCWTNPGRFLLEFLKKSWRNS